MKARWLTVLGVMIVAASLALAASEKAATKDTAVAAPTKEVSPPNPDQGNGEKAADPKQAPEADPFFGLEDLLTATADCTLCGDDLGCDETNVWICCDPGPPYNCGCRAFTHGHNTVYKCCAGVACILP
jgi:hypothetical protein